MTKRQERINKKCKECNKIFKKRPDTIFCSTECCQNYWRKNNLLKMKIYMKEYYLKNKDILDKTNKQWKLSNKQQYKKIQKQYWINNKDRILKNIKADRKLYPKKYRNWELTKRNNPNYNKRMNEYMREYTKRPSVRKMINKRQREKIERRIDLQISRRIRNRINGEIRKYFKKNKIVPFKDTQSTLNLNVIVKDLIIKLPNDYNERKYHIDHIIPICSFDLTDENQLKEAFAQDNHRWIPAEENLAKIKQDIKQSIWRNK